MIRSPDKGMGTLKARDKTLEQVRRWREESVVVAEEEVAAPPAVESKGEGILHFKDLLPRMLARWHWMAIGLVVGFALGLLGIWRAVPRYEATAAIQVKDNNVSSVTGQAEIDDLNLGSKNAINTMMQSMMRPQLAEALADDPEVNSLPNLMPQEKPFFPWSKAPEPVATPATVSLGKRLRSWTKVSIRPGTGIIDVTVEHPVPQVAQLIANKFVLHYIKEHEEEKKEGSAGSMEFLKLEAERYSKNLQKNHSLLAGYASSLEAEQELAKAEEEIEKLKVRYRAKHPKMIEAVTRLNQKRQRLESVLEGAVLNPGDRKYWDGIISEHGRPGSSPDSIQQYRRALVARKAVLDSQIESENTILQNLLDQKGSKEVTTERAEAPVKLQETAQLPDHPKYPQKFKMLLQATAIGLFAGVALAFLFQYFDNKLHTVADVEGLLGIPVLAAVASLEGDEQIEKSGAESPPESSPDDPPDWRTPRSLWPPTLLFREGTSDSHYAEMFRVLRTSISLLGPAQQRKITMITSALPSEGKTFVAANLAVAMAQQGIRTLLVDFDLRKPSAHKMFGVPKDDRPGIADLLVGQAQPSQIVRTDTGQENLSLILAGPKPPNPGELLESCRLEDCLKIFRNHFDHIVIDTAPLLPVPDSRILAPLVDNRCLVVRAESTPRGAVKRAVNTLEGYGIVPEGIVFNGYVEKRLLIGENYSYGYYQSGKYGYGSYGSVYGQDDED